MKPRRRATSATMSRMGLSVEMGDRGAWLSIVCAALVVCAVLQGAFAASAFAQAGSAPVHGLWVWKSPTVLEAPGGGEALRDFCKSQGINEVYVSISGQSEAEEEGQLARMIVLMHGANIRVEALLSSTDADEPGKHRETLLEEARVVVQFNARHSAERFDGIHLDVEPQQRPENKGAGNLRFVPGLVDAFREVRSIAEPAGMTVNADIQNKLLKGDLAERRMLLASVPRVTLMMYELSSPGDGESAEQMADKAQRVGQNYLAMAYEGLSGEHVAKMAIALRTPDYGELIGQMLKRLDEANGANPHYLGWARHSYNDYLVAAN